MTTRIRLLFALPALGLAVTALVLATGTFAVGEVPARPIPTETVVVSAPGDLVPTVTSRDWQEMNGSGFKRKYK